MGSFLRYAVPGILLALLLGGCSAPDIPVISSVKNLPIIGGKHVKREYFANGQVRSEFYMDDESGKNGTLKTYGLDGKLISVATIRNGVKDGIETWYDKQGRILMKVPYENGRKNGVQTAYYANGEPMITYTYVRGIKEGPAVVYNKDGSIARKMIFHHGRLIQE